MNENIYSLILNSYNFEYNESFLENHLLHRSEKQEKVEYKLQGELMAIFDLKIKNQIICVLHYNLKDLL